VRGGDFPNGRILIERLRTISRVVHVQYRRTHLREGDVVVSLVGQPGSCAVVPRELENANVARQAALVRTVPTFVSPDSLCLYIGSRNGKRALLGDTLGSVQQVVNLRDLRGLKLLLPPVDEQRRIASHSASASATIEVRGHERSKLCALKSALMHDLLTGRVRTTL
jgi:type I restriction enzyme S subunit